MRLLLDESVPRRLRLALENHEVQAVGEAGRSGVKNGELLALAAEAFDVFITVDRNLPYQQNLASLPIAGLSPNAHAVELSALLPLIPGPKRRLPALVPHSFVRISDRD